MMRQFRPPALAGYALACALGWAAPALTAPTAAPATRVAAPDAAQHVDEEATVCGTVAGAKYAAGARGKPTFLDFERPYPAAGFRVVIWGSDRPKFKPPPETAYGQGKVCVTGKIHLYRGEPEIIVRAPSQLARE
jgi:hypothetical protein